MIKGTPQAERNNTWHTRHTKRKATDILFRKHSIMSGRRAVMASVGEMKKAEEGYKVAKARETEKKLGITKGILYTLRNIWRRIMAVFRLTPTVT